MLTRLVFHIVVATTRTPIILDIVNIKLRSLFSNPGVVFLTVQEYDVPSRTILQGFF